LGPLDVQKDGEPVTIAGVEPRAILSMLGLCSDSVVATDVLVDLLWGKDPPRSADEAVRSHVSSLRRTLGDGVVMAEGDGWTLSGSEVDAAGSDRLH
jgi:DNA-binding SARP family transcriptional activator